MVHEFVLNLENLPKWSTTFPSIKQLNGEWLTETPQGQAKIKSAERNDFGIFDHHVTLSSGVEVFVPLRVVQNGEGSEVIVTLFQTADMSDERFAEDAKLVEQDLNTLKNIMEEK